VVTAGKSEGHGFGGRLKQPQHLMLLGEIVYPAGETANRSLPGEPMEGDIDCCAAAQMEKIGRYKYRSSAASSDCSQNLRINALRRFCR
jgi:hypothetical protein